MRYLGGKHRQGRKIAEFVVPHLKPGMTYIEPFCGALGVVRHVVREAPAGVKLVLSDKNEALITMWKALMGGWIPPSTITEKEYGVLKKTQDPKDPLTAFAAFGCSFAAKWFGTYARNRAGYTNFAKQAKTSIEKKIRPLRNYAEETKTNALEKVRALSGAKVSFHHRDYNYYAETRGAVFYLDPPYFGRTKQSPVTGSFDHEEFWDFARDLSKHNVVYVTEFVAPPGLDQRPRLRGHRGPPLRGEGLGWDVGAYLHL